MTEKQQQKLDDLKKKQMDQVYKEARIIVDLFKNQKINALKLYESQQDREMWDSWFNLLGAPFKYKSEIVSGLRVFFDVLGLEYDLNKHPLLSKSYTKEDLDKFLETKVNLPKKYAATQTIQKGLEAYILAINLHIQGGMDKLALYPTLEEFYEKEYNKYCIL